MNKKYRVVAFIPVRGGSVSIPQKNIKPIAGKPLLHWVTEAALGCSFIDQVYISTDSTAISQCATNIMSEKLTVIDRSPESATNTSSSEVALLEFATREYFDIVVMIQATSPLLTTAELEAAWRTYREGGYQSLLSVVRQKRFLWDVNSNGHAFPLNYDPQHRPRRQEFAGFLVENGAFYITSRDCLLTSGCRISGRTGVFTTSEESYFELDELSDWVIIEELLNKRKRHSPFRERLNLVKVLVMDVDGVLTDTGMYYAEDGNEMKKFSARDGKGLELIRKLGVRTAILTGENTEIVRHRAQKLNIDYVRQGVQDKGAALAKMATEMGLTPDEVAYIGDDVNDLPAIEMAGISFCPADAVPEVLRKVDAVLSARGGNGAVREVCQLLIDSIRGGHDD